MRKSLTSAGNDSAVQCRVVILEPPGCDLSALHRAFAEQDEVRCSVRRVASCDELVQLVGESRLPYVAAAPQHLGQEHVAELMQRLRDLPVEVPVVIVAEQGDVDAAAAAVRAGAADFLVLGARLEERVATLLGKLRKLLQSIHRNALLDEQFAEMQQAIKERLKIVGVSPQVRKLVKQIARVAPVPRPVLICGERGTGKELIARAIHFASGAADRPIVTVNCAAFGDALLESELFGHEKGAFTGADETRRGKFEQASGGVLFLDEIGHMSPAFQQKILRVVEYGVFTRVGGSEELHTTARIIAATNCDLKEMIRRGEFLADLYDRLSFEVLQAAPLRQRPDDVPILAQHFLDQFAREASAFQGKKLAPATIQALQAYSFPGNVRELKNIIERGAYRDTTNEITPADLGLPVDAETSGGGTFDEQVHAYSRRLIDDALKQASGNQAQAARLLGLKYHQFRYYLKKYTGDGE